MRLSSVIRPRRVSFVPLSIINAWSPVATSVPVFSYMSWTAWSV